MIVTKEDRILRSLLIGLAWHCGSAVTIDLCPVVIELHKRVDSLALSLDAPMCKSEQI